MTVNFLEKKQVINLYTEEGNKNLSRLVFFLNLYQNIVMKLWSSKKKKPERKSREHECKKEKLNDE